MFKPTKRSSGVSAAALAALVFTGCANGSAQEAGGDDQLTVYATTGYLADAVENIAPMPK